MTQLNTKAEELKVNVVEEAIKLLYPFTFNGRLAEQTSEQLLKEISVFDALMINSLLKRATDAEIVDIVNLSADLIVQLSAEFEPEQRHKMRWRENTKKILDKVRERYVDLFQMVDFDVLQESLYRDLYGKIMDSKDRVIRNVGANLCDDEKRKKIVSQIVERFAALQMLVLESELVNESKQSLLDLIEPTKAEALSHVEDKFAEVPTKLLYYKNSSGGVSVKVKFNKGSWGYHIGRGKQFRHNYGLDAVEYPLIVSLNYINDFLSLNDVKGNDIFVSEDSVDVFYGFRLGNEIQKISPSLTESFVKMWYNYDCPDLVRFKPNKDQGVSDFGLSLPHFENVLVESSWSADYIDDTITEEEVQLLSKGFEHTRITKSMKETLEARLVEKAGEVETLRKAVTEYDAKIQEVINANASEIIQGLVAAYPERAQIKHTSNGEEVHFKDEFGLDCGYLNIQTKDASYTHNRNVLRNLDRNVSAWMDVHLPYASQSTTFNRKQFEIAQAIVKRELNIDLYCHTVLD